MNSYLADPVPLGPLPYDAKVLYLIAIKDPVWSYNDYNREKIPENLVEGSKSWILTTNEDRNIFSWSSIHLEQNKYSVNFDPNCFKVISKEEYYCSTEIHTKESIESIVEKMFN